MKIIAIDGPAGAGKGTISKFLSEKFGFVWIDSGLYYRYLGLQIFEDGSLLNNFDALINIAHNISFENLQDSRLRLESVANYGSQVAVEPVIRSAITQKIRDEVKTMEKNFSGAIVDGRDVGTVIFPNADIKLFITASEDKRIQRREAESIKTDLKQFIQNRDHRDQTRSTSPLTPALNAIVIDTTYFSLDETKEKTYQIVKNNLLFTDRI